MKELLQTLCVLDAPSSFEDTLRDWIWAQATPYTQDIRTDAMGNLIIRKRGARSCPDKLMLAAHMDEVGLLIRSITDDGYLKFVTLGGIDRRVLIGKRVLVGTDRLPGIIGIKAYHLGAPDERKKTPRLTELFIDIGAQNREEAETYVSLGDAAVFEPIAEDFGSGCLRAKALDDRIGCALLLTLLRQDLPLDCTFVFTVQEEVGTRGAFGAAFSVQPDIALVLEGTTAADLPDATGHKKVCLMGGGPVVPFMDGNTVYDEGLYHLLRNLAKEEGIAWQTKHYISGGTDAGSIQRTREGVRVAGISAPVRYLHSSASLVNLTDFEAMLHLATAFLKAIAADI